MLPIDTLKYADSYVRAACRSLPVRGAQAGGAETGEYVVRGYQPDDPFLRRHGTSEEQHLLAQERRPGRHRPLRCCGEEMRQVAVQERDGLAHGVRFDRGNGDRLLAGEGRRG
eukprot:gene15800-biopygen12684